MYRALTIQRLEADLCSGDEGYFGVATQHFEYLCRKWPEDGKALYERLGKDK
jgi:hypothetical protein